MIAQTFEKVKLYALKCRNFYNSTVCAKQLVVTLHHYTVASPFLLKLYLLHPPSARLCWLLKQSVPKEMHDRLGITDGSWCDHLVGENGVLEIAVESYRTELKQLEEERERATRENNYDEAAKLDREIQKLRAGPDDKVQTKKLIDFLTRNNVLPKYGFPVDTVELQVGAHTTDASSGLQLSRDLQMAVAVFFWGYHHRL